MKKLGLAKTTLLIPAALAILAVVAFFVVGGTFLFAHTITHAYLLLPLVGFVTLGPFGGYSIYFPELFPTRLRASGAGFCYNVGRVLAAGVPKMKSGLKGLFMSGAMTLPFLPAATGNAELARRFTERYPTDERDWRAALGRSGPRWPGDAYYRMLSLPATWVTVYPESVALPRISTVPARRAWLEAQAELGQRLRGLGLGLDDFLWSVRDTSVVDSGTVKPAILAVGRSTIACIEQDIVMPDTWPWFVRRVYGSAVRPLFWQEEAPARPPAQPRGLNVVLR